MSAPVEQKALGYTLSKKANPSTYIPNVKPFDPVTNIAESNLSKIYDRLAPEFGVPKNPRLQAAFKKEKFETFTRDFGQADERNVTDKSMEFLNKYKTDYSNRLKSFIRQGYVNSTYDPNVDQTSQK